MLPCRALLPALLAPACLGIRTKISVEDGCLDGGQDVCVLVNRAFDFPQFARGDVGEHFNFTVMGTTLGALSHGWQYRARATILGVPAWDSSGIGCSDTVFGDSVAFRAEVGLPPCGTPAGAMTIPGSVRISIPALPYPARIKFHFDMDDEQGRPAVRLLLTFAPALTEGAAAALPPTPPPRRLAAPALGAVTATDCCAPGACLLQGVTLDFPPSLHMGDLQFTVAGTIAVPTDELRFGLKATMHAAGVVPLTVLLGNGSACGATTMGDYVEFNMQLPFQSCPIAAGVYALHGHAKFTAPLDALGRLEILVETSDPHGRPATCTHVDVRFLGPAPNPGPPPLPPPTAKYVCLSGACVADPTGADEVVCQAAC